MSKTELLTGLLLVSFLVNLCQLIVIVNDLQYRQISELSNRLVLLGAKINSTRTVMRLLNEQLELLQLYQILQDNYLNLLNQSDEMEMVSVAPCPVRLVPSSA